MNIDKYRILLLVEKNKRLSEIAQMLNISQPTVTFHLKSLEETLGIKIFHHQNKFISLTEAGKSLISYAHEIVQLEDILTEKANQYKYFHQGAITIGATLSPSLSILPDIISEFTKAHPKLHITLETASTSHIIQNITARKYDIGFISSNTELPPYLYTKQLKVDPLVLVFPYSLSSIFQKQGKEGFYNYLNQFNFIYQSESSSTRQAVEKYFSNYSIEIFSSITVSSSVVIKELVKREMGISILPLSLVKDAIEHKLFDYLELGDTQLIKSVKLLYHEDLYLSPIIQKFLCYC
jgi:DNA-binding transcriptional LysR family regulator